MMTVHFDNAVAGPTRLTFDPLKEVPDWSQGGKPAALYDLYVRDVDAHQRPAWIEDPDGFYAYRNRLTESPQ